MDRVIKINSLQGSFNDTKNLIDFVIPRGEVYDLSQSYININLSVDAVDATPTASGGNVPDSGGTGIYNVALSVGGQTESLSLPNSSIVKNCGIYSSTKGKIEDRRRNDVFTTNTAFYDQDLMSQVDRLSSLSGIKGTSGMSLSPFRRFNVLGDVPSSDQTQDLRINLKDLFNVGSVPQFDCNLYGDVKIHCEMNFDKLGAINALPADDAKFTTVEAGQTEANNKFVGVLNDTGGAVAIGTAAYPLLSARTYIKGAETYESPYYVGMKVAMTSTTPGVAAARTRIITKISRYADPVTQVETGQLAIELDASFTDLGDNATFDGLLNGVAPDSIRKLINNAELVLHVVESPSKVPKSLTYTTITTEHDNGGNQQVFNKVYQIEPNVSTLYVMFPTDVVSRNAILSKYRFAFDGEEDSNRDIVVADPLHYERLNRAALNAGKPIGNLVQRAFDVTNRSTTGANIRPDNNGVLVLQNPVPQKNEPQLLSLHLEHSKAGLGNFILFKEMVKTI